MSFDIEVVRDSLRAFEQSIVPAIQVTIRFKLDEDMIPLNIKGSVYSVDNKFISTLTELPPIDVRNNKAPQHVEHGYISKITHLMKEISAGPISNTYDLMFTLDKKTLDYIEERRYETKNHDVIFNFYLTLSALRPSIRIGEFRPHSIQQNVSAVISSTGSPAESDPNFSILVLYDKDGDKNTLLFKKLIEIKTTYTIPSSTWVNDFQERLGLGKFLIVD